MTRDYSHSLGTIAENISLGTRWREDEGEHESHDAIARAAEAAGLAPLLARLPKGLDTVIGEGVQMSGGEKQRVAIARLVLSEAPVVLLDEFTSALDKTTRDEIIGNLRQLLEGRTVICIAHQPEVLADLGITRVLDLSTSKRAHIEK